MARRRNSRRSPSCSTAIGGLVTRSWPRMPSASISSTTRRPTSPRTPKASAGGRSGAEGLTTIAVGDRIAPVAAERAPAHAYARRRLAPLVFGTLDHIQHARDDAALEAALADL